MSITLSGKRSVFLSDNPKKPATMKKLLLLLTVFVVCLHPAGAQKAKKTPEEKQAKADTAESRSEKQRQFWKKVGENERDFWKGEHERRVKSKEERDKKEGKTPDSLKVEKARKEPPPPPKPPNPFKKKKKEKESTGE